MREQIKISHKDLCLAVAKRFNKKFALYEYKSFASAEEPDVLVFDTGGTVLFEIKVSLADFKKDQKKDARKKYTVPLWAYHLPIKGAIDGKKYSEILKTQNGQIEVVFIEKTHLGNRRYYVCPWGLIPVEIVPEGWGLLYFKHGNFFLKKESAKFRSNLRTENNLAIHALRRYASGDSTGILVNTYGGKKNARLGSS
jgi:hypothetical protein